MKRFCLRYKFHTYNISMEEKSAEDKEIYFDKLEDLLATYRKKKNALFAGIINYNTDFEVYAGHFTKQDISFLDDLL